MHPLHSVIVPGVARLGIDVVTSSGWLQQVFPLGVTGTVTGDHGGDDTRTNLTVPKSEARATAGDALGSPPDGQWRLTDGVTHTEEEYYTFRFVLTDTDWSGIAEIDVDGSSGHVLRIKREVYPQEESSE